MNAERPESNRWVPVGLVLGAGWLAPVFLYGFAAVLPWRVLSAAVFYGGTILATVAVTFAIRSLTRTRYWWLISALASPATLVVGLILAANLLMRFGPVGASETAGISYYPPPASAKEINFTTNWQYAASWACGSKEPGSYFTLQDKTVWIYIENKAGSRLVEDKFQLRCCHPHATALWPRPEYVEITLSEEGLERYTGGEPVQDAYSVALAKSGPRPILKLAYTFDSKAGRFRRTSLTVLNPAAVSMTIEN